MRFARPRTAWTIGATIVGMLLIGWPILTAIHALFWSVRIFDAASDADLAAERIIARMPGLAKYRIVEDRPSDLNTGARDCAAESGAYHAKDGKMDQVVIDTSSAIYKSRNDLDSLDVYLVELESLKSLPMPILGALDGCIRGSLLAPYCETRARTILQSALDKERVNLKRQFGKNAARAGAMLCVALDGMKPR